MENEAHFEKKCFNFNLYHWFSKSLRPIFCFLGVVHLWKARINANVVWTSHLAFGAACLFIPVKWQSTLEPVLGTLVNFLGMRGVNTRGPELAGKCMLMAAVCYNLKKLLKFSAPKAVAQVVSMAKRMEKEAKAATLLLLAVIVLPASHYSRIKLQ